LKLDNRRTGIIKFLETADMEMNKKSVYTLYMLKHRQVENKY
jgi:hypothetical protein